ncbi:MAG: valine--tRNA ligase, partial [Candidatus Rokuibacteriota bacterium]
EMRISPAVMLDAMVRPARAHRKLLGGARALVEALARCRLGVDPAATRPRASALGVVGETEIYVALEGLVDLDAERQRLDKEIRRAEEAIGFTRAKLTRPEFVERAPAEVVEKEREKLAAEEARRAKLVASLGWLAGA